MHTPERHTNEYNAQDRRLGGITALCPSDGKGAADAVGIIDRILVYAKRLIGIGQDNRSRPARSAGEGSPDYCGEPDDGRARAVDDDHVDGRASSGNTGSVDSGPSACTFLARYCASQHKNAQAYAPERPENAEVAEVADAADAAAAAAAPDCPVSRDQQTRTIGAICDRLCRVITKVCSAYEATGRADDEYAAKAAEMVDELVRTTKAVRGILTGLGQIGDDRGANPLSGVLDAIRTRHCELLSLVALDAHGRARFDDGTRWPDDACRRRSASEQSIYNGFVSCLKDPAAKANTRCGPAAGNESTVSAGAGKPAVRLGTSAAVVLSAALPPATTVLATADVRPPTGFKKSKSCSSLYSAKRVGSIQSKTFHEESDWEIESSTNDQTRNIARPDRSNHVPEDRTHNKSDNGTPSRTDNNVEATAISNARKQKPVIVKTNTKQNANIVSKNIDKNITNKPNQQLPKSKVKIGYDRNNIASKQPRRNTYSSLNRDGSNIKFQRKEIPKNQRNVKTGSSKVSSDIIVKKNINNLSNGPISPKKGYNEIIYPLIVSKIKSENFEDVEEKKLQFYESMRKDIMGRNLNRT